MAHVGIEYSRSLKLNINTPKPRQPSFPDKALHEDTTRTWCTQGHETTRTQPSENICRSLIKYYQHLREKKFHKGTLGHNFRFIFTSSVSVHLRPGVKSE